MKKMYGQFLLLAGLGFVQCSSKEKSPSPSNPIAANTAAVKIDGVAFPADMSRTVATISGSTGELWVTLATKDAQGPRVTVRIPEFRKRTEVINPAAASKSRIELNGPLIHNVEGDFGSQYCGSVDRKFEIVEFDEARKTVSVKFSGSACGGPRLDKVKKISEGQVNLSYVII
jgi:hypothetical protein